MMKEHFVLHVIVSPIEIWEILMEWNHGIRSPRQKLRIGTTGNAGPGNPALNALTEVIEAIVGSNSIGEVQKDLTDRGAMAEIPPPTYGHMRRDDFYIGSL